jgi:hypothetical protein
MSITSLPTQTTTTSSPMVIPNIAPPPFSSLDREKCKIHLKDALLLVRSRSYAHRIQGDTYSKKAIMMHLPVLIFNVISAVLSYFLDGNLPELRFAVMGFTTFAVVLSSIDNYLGLGESALKHQSAARQYDGLGARISRYLSIQDVGQMIDASNKVNELIQQLAISPDIPLLSVQAEEFAYDRVRIKRASFSVTRRAIAELTGREEEQRGGSSIEMATLPAAEEKV